MVETPVENDANEVLRGFVTSEEGASDWPHKKMAVWLSRMSQHIGFSFYSPKTEADPPLPPILIGIGPMNVNTYAGYYLDRNDLGLRWMIKCNGLHRGRSRWSLAETLTHEMGHVYQEEVLQNGAKPPYHNKVFVDMMEELGIHAKLGEGYHYQPADLDGQFGRLMDKLCIAPPPPLRPETKSNGNGRVRPWWEGYDKPKGGSTLTLYTAEGCVRSPICKVRAGRKDLHLRCDDCASVFTPN